MMYGGSNMFPLIMECVESMITVSNNRRGASDDMDKVDLFHINWI